MCAHGQVPRCSLPPTCVSEEQTPARLAIDTRHEAQRRRTSFGRIYLESWLTCDSIEHILLDTTALPAIHRQPAHHRASVHSQLQATQWTTVPRSTKGRTQGLRLGVTRQVRRPTPTALAWETSLANPRNRHSADSALKVLMERATCLGRAPRQLHPAQMAKLRLKLPSRNQLSGRSPLLMNRILRPLWRANRLQLSNHESPQDRSTSFRPRSRASSGPGRRIRFCDSTFT